MHENEISGQILDRVFQIHSKLGTGLFESVYEEILFYELKSKGFVVERQKPISIAWKDLKFAIGFRCDLLVESKVIIELKSVEKIAPMHQKQVLTYLRLTGLKLGILINFNVALIKNGFHRIVNNL